MINDTTRFILDSIIEKYNKDYDPTIIEESICINIDVSKMKDNEVARIYYARDYGPDGFWWKYIDEDGNVFRSSINLSL